MYSEKDMLRCSEAYYREFIMIRNVNKDADDKEVTKHLDALSGGKKPRFDSYAQQCQRRECDTHTWINRGLLEGGVCGVKWR